MKRLGPWLLAIGIFLMLAVVPTAVAQPGPGPNHPGYWGDDCAKVEPVGTPTWTADRDYRLVVLKFATTNQEHYDVKAGDVLATATGQDISHLILCYEEVPPSTTTTTTSTTSTTTTAPPTTSTTTTTTLPPSTTTTSTTTTTTTSTTTTVPPTTTTSSTTTTTVPPATTTTAPPPTLPVTGPVKLSSVFKTGLLLLALGATLVFAAADRQRG